MPTLSDWLARWHALPPEKVRGRCFRATAEGARLFGLRRVVGLVAIAADPTPRRFGPGWHCWLVAEDDAIIDPTAHQYEEISVYPWNLEYWPLVEQPASVADWIPWALMDELDPADPLPWLARVVGWAPGAAAPCPVRRTA